MKTLVGQPVFAVDGTAFGWEDVVACAMRSRAWSGLERQAGEGVGRFRRALELGLPAARADADAVGKAFRYERRLLAASDLRAWLAARGLGVGDFLAFTERAALRAHRHAESGDEQSVASADDPEVVRILHAEGRLSGLLARFAEELARRAAAAAAADVEPTEVQDPALAARLVAALGLSQDSAGGLAARQRAIEAGYDAFCAERVTRAALAEQVELRHLDWIAVDCVRATFDREPAAREALLCVREDGSPLADVARRAGTVAVRERLALEDVDEALRGPLLSAAAGDLLGPLAQQGAFSVVEVLAKTPPGLDDPEVHARARLRLLQSALQREVDRRVSWRGAL